MRTTVMTSASRGWRRRSGAGAVAAVALVAGTVAAGCGSHSSAAGKTTSSSSGKTITAVSIQDSVGLQADAEAGIAAAVKAINASGGILGRKLVVRICQDNNDPNQAATCARNAVANSSVIAVVSATTTFGANVDSVLGAGDLPDVGSYPTVAADYAAKDLYNTSPGGLMAVAEAVMLLKSLKGTKIGIPYIDVPAGASLKPTVAAVVGPSGGKIVANVPVPPTAADLTSEAAAVEAAHPDGIINGLTAAQMTQFIQTYRQQGGKTPFLLDGYVLDAGQIAKQLKGVNQNVYVAESVNHASAGYAQFMSNMSKYEGSYPNRNDDVAQGWLGVEMLAKALEKAGKVSRTTLASTLNSWTDFNLGNITPPINFTQKQKALGGTLPRLQDPYFYPTKYENGKLVSLNDWKPISIFNP